MNILKQKEKFVKELVLDYSGKCPLCRAIGKTRVLPFGDDYFFCENKNCKCTRHMSSGHYEITEESIHAPNVTYIDPSMIIKS